MTNINRAGQKGFSLLEVIAAMSVLAFAVTALLKLSSGGLSLSRAAEDKTALVFAADALMRSFWQGQGSEPFMETNEVTCHGEVFPFRQETQEKLVKIVVTATDKKTGASFTLTSLKEE